MLLARFMSWWEARALKYIVVGTVRRSTLYCCLAAECMGWTGGVVGYCPGQLLVGW